MNYYLRPRHTNDVFGPISVEEINALGVKGAIAKDWLATSDLGESVNKLRTQSERDWFEIVKLAPVQSGDFCLATTKDYKQLRAVLLAAGVAMNGTRAAQEQTGDDLPGTRSVGEAAQKPRDVGNPASKLMNRYREAYRVAHALAAVGTFIVRHICRIRWAPILLGVYVIIHTALTGPAKIMGSFLLGLLGWVSLLLIGLLQAAQAQLLIAFLDTAVNTSPHLTTEQKAEIMSIT